MTIREKLRIISILPLCIFLLIGGVYLLTSIQMKALQERTLLSFNLLSAASEVAAAIHENRASQPAPSPGLLEEKTQALISLGAKAAPRFRQGREVIVFSGVQDQITHLASLVASLSSRDNGRLQVELVTAIRAIIVGTETLHASDSEALTLYEKLQLGCSAILLAFLALAVLALTFFLQRHISVPLMHLEEGIKQVSAGDFTETVPVTAEGELGRLTRSFNAMIGRLSEVMARLKRETTVRAAAEALLRRQLEVDSFLTETAEKILDAEKMTVEALSRIFLEGARAFTESAIGYAGAIDPETGLVEAHGLSSEVWDSCQVKGKSQRLHKTAGIWEWMFTSRKTVCANNLASDPRAAGAPPGHVAVTRFLCAPALAGGRLLGQIALANAPQDYTDRDVACIEKIAGLYAIGLLRLESRDRLEESHAELERRVAERTAALSAANDQLTTEIDWRTASEKRLRATAEALARSNAELEQFASVASHDLQEPLRNIASFTDLLAKKYQGCLDDKADTYMHYIHEGSERMRVLINDLLIYSRVTTRAREPEPTDANAVLGEVLQDLQTVLTETRGQVTSDSLPVVKTDASQLGMLLRNLVGNAIKYHGNDPPRVHITAQPQEGFWHFSVRDNGIGIDPRFYERIFVIFQRLHPRSEYSGTGLGLALCKKIVERHHGKIWVESTPGEGSIFHFTIPAG